MGRKFRLTIAIGQQLLEPNYPTYYNNGAKRLPPLQERQRILLQTSHQQWLPATVVERWVNDYLIQTLN